MAADRGVVGSDIVGDIAAVHRAAVVDRVASVEAGSAVVEVDRAQGIEAEQQVVGSIWDQVETSVVDQT
jgi:hypothetical protein